MRNLELSGLIKKKKDLHYVTMYVSVSIFSQYSAGS